MQIRRASLPVDRDVIDGVVAQVEGAVGQPPLSEEALAALDASSGPAGWLAVQGESVIGFAHIREQRGAPVVEMAILSGGESVVVEALLDRVCADEPAATVRIWAADAGTAEAIEAAGAVSSRRLVRLQCSLPPVDRPAPAGESRIVSFRPGVDEGAYLIVSNEAFEGHPESGGWDLGTFAERAGRPWFDPGGIFLAWERGRPVGACWTKVHPGGVGEIYSIAVRPAAAGRGLGRALVLTGFWYLAERRGVTIGTVWVDRVNDAALRLYRRMGLEPVTEKTELLLLRE